MQKLVTRRIIVVAAVGLMLVGLYGVLRQQFAVRGTATLPAIHDVTTSEADPQEKPITKSQFDDYKVPAGQPRTIKITSIGVYGLVQKVGRTKSNAVGAPSNVAFAGWYNESVLPGQPGLSIIDGHVSGKYAAGIFKELGKLKTGDSIEIEYGDRSTKKFVVLSLQSVPVDQATEVLFKQSPEINEQLTLITCDGPYNRTAGGYDKRLVVVSQLQPN